jgi:DNA-binding CsgD family transcriptional regulator
MNAEQRQQVVAHLSAIHRTLDVLITVGDLGSAASIAKTLGGVWVSHRSFDDGIHYLSTILNLPGADGLSDTLLATLYDNYGELTQGQGHYEQAEGYYKMALAKPIDDPRTSMQLLLKIAMTAYQRGQYEVAGEYCNKALVLARQLDLTEGIAHVHELLGMLAGARGCIAESLDRLAYARALLEQQGYRYGLAQSLNVMGEMERARHNYRTAIDHYQASAALFKKENPAVHMVVKGNLAFALLAIGEVTQAEALFAQGHRYWEANHAPYPSALCLTGLAGVQISTQAYQQAARLMSSASQRFAQSDASFELADRLEYERIAALLQAHLSEDEQHSIQERVAREECNGRPSGPVHLAVTTARLGEVPALSSRELEMLSLVAQGLTDIQIARHCYMSKHTVNSHLRAVYRKLKVNNRSAALHVAHRQGLL